MRRQWYFTNILLGLILSLIMAYPAEVTAQESDPPGILVIVEKHVPPRTESARQIIATVSNVWNYGCSLKQQGGVALYKVVILNHTPLDICQARFTRHYQQAWGNNLLQGILFSGKCAVIEVPAGMFDFQFIPCNREEFPLERYGVIVDKDISLPLIIGYPPGIGVSVECSQKGKEFGSGGEAAAPKPPISPPLSRLREGH